MWIDLTKTIAEVMASYGDDPVTRIKQVKTVVEDGYSLFQLTMGLHTGTHLDGPRHMLNHGEMIDEIPLERLIGQAKLIDARNVHLLTDKHKDADLIEKKDIVLVYGGASKTLIDESFARLLVRKQVKVLGIDFASPDEYPFHIHKLLLEDDILILEHLTNLDALIDQDFIEVVIAPIKIHTDGAIARVFAKI